MTPAVVEEADEVVKASVVDAELVIEAASDVEEILPLAQVPGSPARAIKMTVIFRTDEGARDCQWLHIKDLGRRSRVPLHFEIYHGAFVRLQYPAALVETILLKLPHRLGRLEVDEPGATIG